MGIKGLTNLEVKGIIESLMKKNSLIHQGMGNTRDVFIVSYKGRRLKASNEDNFLKNYLNL